MSSSGAETSGRPWMPERSAVVTEKWLTPGRGGTRASAGPASETTTYRILRTTQMDPYDIPLQRAEVATLGIERFAGVDEAFRGSSRKAAKLAIADTAVEAFEDVEDLVATLPAEQGMISRQPPITDDAESGRVEEENRNVRVQAFLYAASREADNDYHLIVGRATDRDPMYMTVELSGLPPQESEHFPRLEATREAYKTFFGDDLPGVTYDFYHPPIPVQVEGSLFFDVRHSSGLRPGPADLRPHIPTIWEIHPITSIVFEP
jgi:hypothetical protein